MPYSKGLHDFKGRKFPSKFKQRIARMFKKFFLMAAVAAFIAPATAGAATFVSDDFTGSAGDLAFHSAPIGGAWGHVTANVDAINLNGSGEVYATGTGNNATYYNSGAPIDGDQFVQATINAKSLKGFFELRCRQRTDKNEAYALKVTPTSMTIQKRVQPVFGGASTVTDLATTSISVINGIATSYSFSCNGSSLQGTYIFTGATVSATDSSITIPGQAALRLRDSTATTGLVATSFTASDL